MKISEILNDGKLHLSCELFPPKKGENLPGALEVVRATAALSPSFISVTYGAGGGTREFTAEMARSVRAETGIEALAHMTCVVADRESVKQTLEQYRACGIENILALRGDVPAGMEEQAFRTYRHASDLMDEIRAFGGFAIGGACYPEGHPEAQNADADIDYLKLKMEHGCDFFTTQMFFDNNIFYHFLYRLLAKGVSAPIIAGIMPIVSEKQVLRTAQLSGTALPRRFLALVERFGSNPAAMRQAGIAYATEQIIDLIANGVNHIHIYTMNKPDVAAQIFSNLSEIYEGGRA